MDDQHTAVIQLAELDPMQPTRIIAAAKIQPIQLQDLGEQALRRNREPDRFPLQPNKVCVGITAPQFNQPAQGKVRHHNRLFGSTSARGRDPAVRLKGENASATRQRNGHVDVNACHGVRTSTPSCWSTAAKLRSAVITGKPLLRAVAPMAPSPKSPGEFGLIAAIIPRMLMRALTSITSLITGSSPAKRGIFIGPRATRLRSSAEVVWVITGVSPGFKAASTPGRLNT